MLFNDKVTEERTEWRTDEHGTLLEQLRCNSELKLIKHVEYFAKVFLTSVGAQLASTSYLHIILQSTGQEFADDARILSAS